MKILLKQIVGCLLVFLQVTAAMAQKDSFELNVLPATATNIQWYVNKDGTQFVPLAGENSLTYLVNDEGMYYATFTDRNCANASAYFIFIDEGKSNRVYDYPLELNSFDGADSYQWYNNNTAIATATNQRYSVTADGDYYVRAVKGYCRMNSAHFITRKVKEYINNPPIAVDDKIDGNANKAIDIMVLDNDSDPDNDVLAKTEILQQPRHGSIHKNSTGDYTYTPRKNYVGTDTLTYRVCDTFGACREAKVFITVSCLDVNLLEIPQFISPNDDSYNDLWAIKDLLAAAQCGPNPVSLMLFNRWGALVWDISTDDTKDKNFKGKAEGSNWVFESGKELPTGVYFYVIAVEGKSERRTGYIYIASTN